MKTNINLFGLKGAPYIVNNRMKKQLQQAFQNEYGGMMVLLSPGGSGKTMSLHHLANEHIHNGGAVRIFGNELRSMNDFYSSFGGTERRLDLFNVLPEKSVIVLDQLECLKLFPEEMENLLLHLACESCRTAECNIIVSLSDAELANKVLRLNGLAKIKQCGTVSDYKWQNNEIEEFFEIGFSTWTTTQKQDVKQLGCIAQNVGFMQAIYTLYHKTGISDADFMMALQKSAHIFSNEWTEFEQYQTQLPTRF